MSMMRSRAGMLLLGATLGGVVGAAAGAELHRRWPIETVEEWLGIDRSPDIAPWVELSSTAYPRYEALSAQVDSFLYVFGGFHNRRIQATARADVLDLRTGQWSRLDDMPTPLTHAVPALVGDTAWIAGGFVGDHPGTATDQVWRHVPGTREWSEGPPLPAPRGGGALVARGDTLHFFGGYRPDRSTDSEDHWVLVPGEGAWRTAAPLPAPRGHHSAALVDGRIYAVGGARGHDPVAIDMTDVHVYDPATDRWSEGPSAPFGTSHTEPSTLRYEDGILLVGGRALGRGRYTTDDVLYLDLQRQRWIHAGRTPIRMLGAVAALRGDTVFAGLGAEEGTNPQNPAFWSASLRDRWWGGTPMPAGLGEVAGGIVDGRMILVGHSSPATLVYDIASGRWSAPGDRMARPARGDHHAAEVVDGRLFLLGGLGDRSPGIVQIYDPVADRWELGPDMPFAAGSSASALIDGMIYVAGGIVDDTTTARAAVLDPGTMTWSPLPPMPRPRNHAASATDGRKLFVFGGRGPGSGEANVVANGYADVQIFDPATATWTVSGEEGGPAPLPQGRGGMGKAVYLDGEFWVLGGETEDGPGATENDTYARVDIYDPRSDTWRLGPDLPTARHGIFPLADAGRIFVAGGGVRAGHSLSSVLEMIWPRSRGDDSARP